LASAWRFSFPYLTKAVEEWRSAHAPSEDQLAAFYDWAMAVTGSGPPASSLPVPHREEEYVDLVGTAGVFVTFLAVAQDQAVFVRLIEPA
jgi:hypothetical protein